MDFEQKDIALAAGFDRGGERLRQVTMREPTVNDTLAAQKAGGGKSGQVEIALLANLCEMSPAEVGSLTMRDYGRLQDALRDFTDPQEDDQAQTTFGA